MRKIILTIALAMMATSVQAGPADDDQFDLTPRQFSVPQPDPDKFFANYKHWAPLARNTAERRMLVQIYNQAKSSYTEAQTAWNQQREVFEAEEGKRLMVESGKASRAAAEARRQLNEAHQDKAAALIYQQELTIRALNSADADRRQKELQDALNSRQLGR